MSNIVGGVIALGIFVLWILSLTWMLHNLTNVYVFATGFALWFGIPAVVGCSLERSGREQV